MEETPSSSFYKLVKRTISLTSKFIGELETYIKNSNLKLKKKRKSEFKVLLHYSLSFG